MLPAPPLPSTRTFALALALVVALAAFVFAQQVVLERNAEIRKVSTGAVPTFLSTLSTLDGSDSTTWGTALTNRSFPTNGDPTLEVTVRHSAEGSTACVAVGHRDKAGNFQGIAGVQTSTAVGGNASGRDASGWYGQEKLYFPLLGWARYEVRVYDVSGSNTVDLKPVTVGATGAAAE